MADDTPSPDFDTAAQSSTEQFYRQAAENERLKARDVWAVDAERILNQMWRNNQCGAWADAVAELVEVEGRGLCVIDDEGKAVPIHPEEVLRLRAENEQLRDDVRELLAIGRNYRAHVGPGKWFAQSDTCFDALSERHSK